MKRILIITFLQLLTSISFSQSSHTISGYVRDASNGEELIGVTVYADSIKMGTTSNTYGFYSLTLPAGFHKLKFSYVGYSHQIISINLKTSTSQNIELSSEAKQMDEVIIIGEAIDENVTSVSMSKNELNISQVRSFLHFSGNLI